MIGTYRCEVAYFEIYFNNIKPRLFAAAAAAILRRGIDGRLCVIPGRDLLVGNDGFCGLFWARVPFFGFDDRLCGIFGPVRLIGDDGADGRRPGRLFWKNGRLCGASSVDSFLGCHGRRGRGCSVLSEDPNCKIW